MMRSYMPRIMDVLLQRELRAFGVVLLTGPKWCGKTTTARQIAKSVLSLPLFHKKNSLSTGRRTAFVSIRSRNRQGKGAVAISVLLQPHGFRWSAFTRSAATFHRGYTPSRSLCYLIALISHLSQHPYALHSKA